MIYLGNNSEYKDKIARFIEDWNSGKEWFTLKTSGSTGNPKEISFHRNTLVSSAQLTATFLNLQPGNSALHCLPVEYVAGTMMLVRSLVLGLKLYVADPSSDPLQQVAHGMDFDFSAMTPMQITRSIQSSQFIIMLRQIGKLIIGGAPVDLHLRMFFKNWENEVYETYGMTETLTHIAMRRLSGREAADSFTALPSITFDTDTRGCLVINAPHVASTPIITNDLVSLLSPVSFRWLGRIDFVINTGGIKIIPEVVEAKLAPFVSYRFAITGRKDKLLGEKVIMLVEVVPEDIQEHFRQELLQVFTQYLQPYERPKEIFFVEHIPISVSGKLLRNEIVNLVLNTKL